MALSLQLGYPDVPKSITNPNVDKKDAIDVGYPMPFLDFIKNINISLEPETLQQYYNFYVTSWNKKSTSSSHTDSQLIVDRYRDFLREVIIQYTTLEEKKFLSSIDFNDPLDLDIVLGFYSKKLKELCSFYNSKRNDVKNGILRKKLQGSVFGVGQTIKELVISYIKNIDDSKMLFDLDSIVSKLEIEIEELYDTYPLYYNQIPDQTIYDNKDLDYGLNIFLKDNETLIDEVFSGISDEIKTLKEVDELFDNKRKLTQKYIATDFYYLSTGAEIVNANGSVTFQILSGKLFDSENTILNFLNRTYPTTASTKRENLESPRERGFFKPTNVSIVLINGVNESYSINYEQLEPNSLYFYPDPEIFGDNSGVIKFTIDDAFLKRNTTSGNALNEPVSKPLDTKYYGYYSKIDPNIKKYFDVVYNSGYINDYKQDIYGNSYALFKYGYESYITDLDANDSPTYNVIFNGHEFYDTFYGEQFSFNYNTVDDTTYNETIRTGLSSYTKDFTIFEPDYKFVFGKFKPYYEIIEPTDDNLKKQYRYVDGAILTRSNLALLDDPVSSDLMDFEISGDVFYFTKLIESGIFSSSQRALVDTLYPSITAKFTNYNRDVLYYVNGGRFEDVFNYFQSNDNSVYIDSHINDTQILPISTFSEFDGKLFIKNNNTREIEYILDVIPHISIAYPLDVVDQLSTIVKFEVIYDIIAMETANYIVFEKINYKNNSFELTSVTPQYLSHSSTPFNKISNRLNRNDSIYYFILSSEGNTFDGTLKIYPTIYKYNIKTNINEILYPISQTIPDFFEIAQPNLEYISVASPVLSYSSRNNIYSISFLLKDQNNYPSVVSYDYIMSPDVEFTSKKHTLLSRELISNTFYMGLPNTLNVYLSASPAEIQSDILVI